MGVCYLPGPAGFDKHRGLEEIHVDAILWNCSNCLHNGLDTGVASSSSSHLTSMLTHFLYTSCGYSSATWYTFIETRGGYSQQLAC